MKQSASYRTILVDIIAQHLKATSNRAGQRSHFTGMLKVTTGTYVMHADSRARSSKASSYLAVGISNNIAQRLILDARQEVVEHSHVALYVICVLNTKGRLILVIRPAHNNVVELFFAHILAG